MQSKSKKGDGFDNEEPAHITAMTTKRKMIHEAGPFKIWREPDGTYSIELPGIRRRCYLEEFPVLVIALSKLYVTETVRRRKETPSRGDTNRPGATKGS